MYVVMQIYRIKDQYKERYLEAIKKVVQAGVDIGAVFHEVYEDDDRPGQFIEMMGFDSWTHYKRLSLKPPTTEMASIFKEMDEWIEGGLDNIEVMYLKSVTE